MNSLRFDDIIYIFLVVTGIVIVRFWLLKIYRRVRQIALIMEHFLRKDRMKEKDK